MKKGKSLILLSVIWIILAIGFLVLGFQLAGNDVLAWFTSKWAIMFYTFLGVYVIVLIIMFIIPSIFRRL